MNRLTLAAVLLGLGTSLAFAGAIEDRQALMKKVAATTKAATGYAKGETPFDAAKVKELLAVYEEASAKLPGLFPEDSKTGGDTTAAPKIWEDPAGFKAAAESFGADAKAAEAATDTASFAAAFTKITAHCNACHGAYRVKKG